MRAIVFDTGPIISLATNSLLWLLGNLKERYGGDFLIPKEVEFELVQKPIETKRFKLEALQVNREINKGNLKVVDDEKIHIIKRELLMLANTCFYANGTPIQVVQEGEMAALAAAMIYEAEAVVIDERTTRMIIENPNKLANYMGERLHTKISINKNNLQQLLKRIGNLKVIRSIELAMVGYELGWFDKYLTQEKNARKILIEAILWGIKIRGASISQKEIDKIVNLEK
jgi:predicted nucleic acid-binding protein